MFEKALNSLHSKIPFIFQKSKSEEQILLNCTKNMNMKTFDNQRCSSPDSDSMKCENFDTEFNDFQDGHCRSNSINEWQAGWNVTNAIQVNLQFFFKF